MSNCAGPRPVNGFEDRAAFYEGDPRRTWRGAGQGPADDETVLWYAHSIQGPEGRWNVVYNRETGEAYAERLTTDGRWTSVEGGARRYEGGRDCDGPVRVLGWDKTRADLDAALAPGDPVGSLTGVEGGVETIARCLRDALRAGGSAD